MRQNDDRFFDDEDDNDLWDDELELNSYSPPYGRDQQEYPAYPSEDYISSDSGDVAQETQHTDGPDDYYSDPEAPPLPADRKQTPSARRSRRERFFGRSAEEEEDEGNDFYDSDADPEPEPARRPKLPKLDPEDPDYWISDEEPGIGEIITGTGKRWKWWITAALAILLAIVGVWIWFFSPYIDNAVQYGYIMNMERRGSIIKTFEGTMIPYKEVGDPDPLYFRKLPLSVESDSVAAFMKRMMLRGVPVRIEYEVYRSPLPWKGEQTLIVLKADSTDPHGIRPPEYRFK